MARTIQTRNKMIARKAKAPSWQPGARTKERYQDYNKPVRQKPVDDRQWCVNCGLLVAYNFISRIFDCENSCNLQHAYGYMNTTERRQWFADKIIELSLELPELKHGLQRLKEAIDV